MPSRTEGWFPAKIRAGPPVPCPHCGESVTEGQWQKGHRNGGLYQVYHDDCGEDLGAYDSNH